MLSVLKFAGYGLGSECTGSEVVSAATAKRLAPRARLKVLSMMLFSLGSGACNRGATIHKGGGAGDKGRIVRSEVQDGPSQLLGRGDALQSVQVGHERLRFRRVIHAAIHVGVHSAGQYCIDAHALGTELGSQGLG